jgi:hypothetical protein
MTNTSVTPPETGIADVSDYALTWGAMGKATSTETTRNLPTVDS